MYNILTIGNDCSPAAALRNLNLRTIALPFDWVVSNSSSLEKCFSTHFEFFHKNLYFNSTKKRLIDHYGFEFPHDYPLASDNNLQITDIDHIGEGNIGEEDNKYICDNWLDYYPIVLEKYNRRIKRFQEIVSDPKPILILSRYFLDDIYKIKNLFNTYFNKHNIIFINATNINHISDNIINCNIEENGVWNDITLWQKWFNYAIELILKIN
jgi:Putative papain-like cysteine peptidase (DUF1796)